MKLLRSSRALLLTVLLLTACMPGESTDGGSSVRSSSESSSVMSRPLTAEGTLREVGVSIYMQGTHQLVFDTGEILLLESDTLNLDASIGQRVIVSGDARATVEVGGTIMNVETIETVAMESSSSEEMLVESSSSISSAAASSVEFSAASSATSRSVVASSAASIPPASSVASVASVSSASSAAIDTSASAKAMAKATVDAANFTTKYCTSHIGFCIPLHRNWYYQSFGANVSPYLWHVEVGDKAVETAGDGVIMVNLVSGGLPAGAVEGSASVEGNFAVAMRQWTGNRHFEISAPAELRAAVEFMANGIEVYQVE